MAIAAGFKRLSIDVPIEHAARLRSSYVVDGIKISTRVRILVDLWLNDPELQARVDHRAAELRRAATPD